MIDVHAHFAEEGYAFPGEWQKIKAAGVNIVVLASDTLAHSRMHAQFALEYEGAYFTAGVHPSELEAFTEQTVQDLRTLAQQEKCVAIGEIGLDYHYGDIDKAAQRAAFIRQLELANELALPVQIHSRDACSDTLFILRECRDLLSNGFLLHCYSYGKEEIENFLSLGAYFSFGGVICFKNARRAVEAVGACPKGRILTETDSPYLSPFRGEKNSPCNISVILKKIAEIKGLGLEEMRAQAQKNAHALFPKLK